MATPLTNNTVASTYEALIKIGNNAPIGATLTVLSDGAGTNLPIELSTSTVKITGTLDTTAGVINVAEPSGDSNATTRLYVDNLVSSEETARINADAALQTGVDANLSFINTIFTWTLNGLGLSDAISLVGAGGISVTDNGNDIITIDASGVDVGVTSVNGETGDVTLDADDIDDTSTINKFIDAAGVTKLGFITVTGAVDLDEMATDGDITAIDTRLDALENASYVNTLNGLDGPVTLSAGTNITFDVVGNDIEINASGGGGGGSDSFNTFTVPTQPDVVAASGNDTMNFVDGAGISMTTDNTTKTITFEVDSLGNTPLLFNGVWVGNGDSEPTPTLLANLTVGNATNATSATTATNAVKARVNTTTSGAYRVLLGDTSFLDNDFTDVYANLVGGVTYNTAGNILSAGTFSAANNVAAGGTLSGVTLDISGNADIDGTLTLGGIGNVEGEINQNASDIATLQAQVYSPVVTETTTITIDNSSLATYAGKTILMNSATAIDIEMDVSVVPSDNVEFFVVQYGVGAVSIFDVGGFVTIQSTAGISPSARARYSSFVVKHVGSNNWLVLGDIA